MWKKKAWQGLAAITAAVVISAHAAAEEDGATTQPIVWPKPRVTERADERARMVKQQMSNPVDGRRRIIDEKVLAAMRAVPRHLFVPERHQRSAYADRPLAIGYGQTISQPYIVAFMTEQLKLTPQMKVLEVGTGSGYQAAVLNEFTPNVYTVEVRKALAESAGKRLEAHGYTAVKFDHADGFFGWEEHAPFDAIIVTAAAESIPPALLEQLKPGGVMVIPVGGAWSTQYLVLVRKSEEGRITTQRLMGVRFVPFVRGED